MEKKKSYWRIEAWNEVLAIIATSGKCAIHPSIYFQYCLSGTGLWGNLEPIPGNSGQMARDTLDKVPTHRRAQTHAHSHTSSHTMDNL